LVHPGGPFRSKKDDGAWSIPKGEYREDENPFEVAKRELKKETGYKVYGNFIPLLPFKQPRSPKSSVMPDLIRHPEVLPRLFEKLHGSHRNDDTKRMM
jgi:ADP-ribose pyrophosphatase YjhB (NUDIX family)